MISSVDRRILHLAVPAFGALAAEPLYRLVDTAIVGNLGKDELGGLAIAASVLSLVIAGSNFLAYGTTERVARRLGAHDRVAAAGVGVQAMWLALMIGVTAVPLLVFAARPFSSALGAEGPVLDIAVTYLRISSLGVPFVLLGLAAQGIQRGSSDYRTALVVLIASNVVNVVVEVVLVFGFDLGVRGAAWSTVVAQVLAGCALTLRSRPYVVATTAWRPTWSEMAPLLSAGRHLLLRVGSMLAVFTGSTAIAARIDVATLAAHQIAVTVFLFLALSLDALAVPAQTLVAEELGRTSPTNDSAEITRRSVRLSVIIGSTLGGLLMVTAPFLARVFTDQSDVIDRATTALIILGVILVPGAVAFAYDGALIGAGDYRFLGRAAFGYLVAIVPAATLVLVRPSVGIAGIWLVLAGWMFLRAAVSHRRAARMFWSPVAAD